MGWKELDMTEWRSLHFKGRQVLFYVGGLEICVSRVNQGSWFLHCGERFGETEVLLSCAWLFMTPWTAARQAPLSMGFPRQEYWSWQPFPSPGYLPDPGMEPTSPVSPTWQADSFPVRHSQVWNPKETEADSQIEAETSVKESSEPRWWWRLWFLPSPRPQG